MLDSYFISILIIPPYGLRVLLGLLDIYAVRGASFNALDQSENEWFISCFVFFAIVYGHNTNQPFEFHRSLLSSNDFKPVRNILVLERPASHNTVAQEPHMPIYAFTYKGI